MIYLIYSEYNDLLELYINKLIDKEKVSSDSIIKYSLDNDSINDIIEECNTLGLFSLKKIVILESTNAFSSKGKEITELIDYLDNYNKNVILVFKCNLDKVDTRKKLYKKVSSVGKVLCLTKDNNYLVNLVKELLSDYKMDNINYFLTVVGTDINNITNELNKLMSYKLEDKHITNNDIDSLCITNNDEEIFALTEAIVKNDIKESIRLYNVFLDKNYEVTAMIGLIASQFRFLLQVKLLYNKGLSNDKIASSLGVHPYRVKLAISNLYYYSKELLESYLIKLFELDKKIKLGIIDKNTAFELFILNKNI